MVFVTHHDIYVYKTYLQVEVKDDMVKAVHPSMASENMERTIACYISAVVVRGRLSQFADRQRVTETQLCTQLPTRLKTQRSTFNVQPFCGPLTVFSTNISATTVCRLLSSSCAPQTLIFHLYPVPFRLIPLQSLMPRRLGLFINPLKRFKPSPMVFHLSAPFPRFPPQTIDFQQPTRRFLALKHSVDHI